MWKSLFKVNIRRQTPMDNPVENLYILSTTSTFECGFLVINSLLTRYPQNICG